MKRKRTSKYYAKFTKTHKIDGSPLCQVSDFEKNKVSSLEELRRISNVIQSLDNLVIQCDDDEFFLGLKESAEKYLKEYTAKMREIIHRI